MTKKEKEKQKGEKTENEPVFLLENENLYRKIQKCLQINYYN